MPKSIYDIKRRTYVFALDVIRFLERLPSDDVSRVIRQQSLRSATSVGANVVEAQTASTKKDFSNFYRYALKSANESIYWLNLLRDVRGASDQDAEVLLDEVTQLAKILAKCLITLKKC